MVTGDKYKIGPSKERRLARVSYVVPICVGTFAYHLGKQASDAASHQWVVYLRSPAGSDLSHVLKRVSFQLHSSFEHSVRECTEPPYEVIERGWGEFDINVKVRLGLCFAAAQRQHVEFHDDAMEPPLMMKHRLKLYENDKDAGVVQSKKPVIREEYDELVFWEPTEEFYNRVKNATPGPSPLSREQGLEAQLPKYQEQMEINQLLAARNKVAEQRARMQVQLDGAEI